MSPAAKRKGKPAKTKAKSGKPKSGKAPSKPNAAPKGAAKKAPAVKERSHCAATDPFGDPCQSARRLPSKYCTIHSYLDR